MSNSSENSNQDIFGIFGPPAHAAPQPPPPPPNPPFAPTNPSPYYVLPTGGVIGEHHSNMQEYNLSFERLREPIRLGEYNYRQSRQESDAHRAEAQRIWGKMRVEAMALLSDHVRCPRCGHSPTDNFRQPNHPWDAESALLIEDLKDFFGKCFSLY